MGSIFIEPSCVPHQKTGEANLDVEYQYTNEVVVGKKRVELDRNHNFFLLVDDGKFAEFGGEIVLRTALEQELAKGSTSERGGDTLGGKEKDKGTPIVTIVIQGGPNTVR